MKKKEIGRFYATTFDENVYEFIVNDNNIMECTTLGIDSIYKIVIKPRMLLLRKDCAYISPAKPHVKDDLIQKFDIPEELFNYLKENKMILYSTDMAYLYGFNDKDGYDRQYKEGHPYKWAEKKGPILVKQRQGIYN